MSEESEERKLAYLKAMLDLTYPEAKDGTRVDLTAFQSIVAYHMIRCGWRMDIDKRMIKSRKVTARGVVENAIDWVPIDTPADPLDRISTMTMAEIDALPPSLKAEAVQRMTGEVLPDLPENPGWKVETSIRITDDTSEPEDGFKWTERSAAT